MLHNDFLYPEQEILIVLVLSDLLDLRHRILDEKFLDFNPVF